MISLGSGRFFLRKIVLEGSVVFIASQDTKQKIELSCLGQNANTVHLSSNPFPSHDGYWDDFFLVTILKQTNVFNTFISYTFKVHFNIILPLMISCTKSFLPVRFSEKWFYVFLVSLVHWQTPPRHFLWRQNLCIHVVPQSVCFLCPSLTKFGTCRQIFLKSRDKKFY
jgi:hypothetical protein